MLSIFPEVGRTLISVYEEVDSVALSSLTEQKVRTGRCISFDHDGAWWSWDTLHAAGCTQAMGVQWLVLDDREACSIALEVCSFSSKAPREKEY